MRSTRADNLSLTRPAAYHSSSPAFTVLMPDEARSDGSDHGTPDRQSGAQANTSDLGTQRQMRERVIQLVFGGEPPRFNEFVRVLSDATPAGVDVILRGSSVTGHKFGSDEPFDADGPGTSDLDVTFVGGDMVTLFREFHIPGIHSAPLSKEHPFASPALGPLRERLSAMTHRAVNLQATTSLVQYLRDVAMDQPYLVLLKKPKPDEAGIANT
ncbi:MAG TPA: hypothetical protein VF887_05615 [Gemmatimonadaceae bacterium]